MIIAVAARGGIISSWSVALPRPTSASRATTVTAVLSTRARGAGVGGAEPAHREAGVGRSEAAFSVVEGVILRLSGLWGTAVRNGPAARVLQGAADGPEPVIGGVSPRRAFSSPRLFAAGLPGQGTGGWSVAAVEVAHRLPVHHGAHLVAHHQSRAVVEVPVHTAVDPRDACSAASVKVGHTRVTSVAGVSPGSMVEVPALKTYESPKESEPV